MGLLTNPLHDRNITAYTPKEQRFLRVLLGKLGS